MRRSALLLLFMGVLALTAEGTALQQTRPILQGQQPPQFQPPPPQQQPQPQPPNPQQQMQGMITDLYVRDFSNEFGLTNEQFLKLNPPLRNFMQQRFRIATVRADVTQRLERLAAQPNAPADMLEMLLAEKTRLDRQFLNRETELLEAIRPEMGIQKTVQVMQFNKKFFDENLQKLIEQARAAVAARPIPPPPPDRPNQAKDPNNNRRNNPNGPIDAFQQQQRGKQKLQ